MDNYFIAIQNMYIRENLKLVHIILLYFTILNYYSQ